MTFPVPALDAAMRFLLWWRPRHRSLALLLLTGVALGAQPPASGAGEARPGAAPEPAETRETRVARADRARIRGRADAPVWIGRASCRERVCSTV